MKKDVNKQNEKGWKSGKLMRSKKGYTGSILPMFMFNLAIMFALYMFVSTDPSNPYVTNTFMESFLDFTNWDKTFDDDGNVSYLGWLMAALGAGSAVLISASILGWKSEFPIYAGWSMIIWTSFVPTYTTLYNLLVTQFGGTEYKFLAMLIFAPLAAGWLFTVMEFARGRD